MQSHIQYKQIVAKSVRIGGRTFGQSAMILGHVAMLSEDTQLLRYHPTGTATAHQATRLPT
eukprot:2354701-Amphidinium_carterae.1